MIENDRQTQAKRYCRRKWILSLANLAGFCAYLAVIQFTGASLRLKESILPGDNFYIALALYFLMLNLIYYAISFPLHFYQKFSLEHKFSLSNQTLKCWLKDEAKQGLVSIIISLMLIEALYAIARHSGPVWWIACSIFWLLFSVVLARIFPVVIIPLFYKYKALTDNKLRDKVLELARKFRINVMNVSEIDFSRNTKKSNAAVVGLGATKRVILADNLIKDFSPEEVEVVVAHEMAHHKLKHIWKLFALSSILTFLSFYILNLAASYLAGRSALDHPFDIALLPGILLFFTVYGFLAMPVQNGISRKLETDADLLAISITGLKDSFVSLMERFAEKNLSDKNPPRIIEILLYDHPPIGKRIKSAGRA